MKKYLSILLVLSLTAFAYAVESGQRCSNLKIPASVSEELLKELISIIPKSEKTTLYRVEHVSDNEMPNRKIGLVVTPSEYGIVLSYREGTCGGDNSYYFVKTSDGWKLNDERSQSGGPVCLAPKGNPCEKP